MEILHFFDGGFRERKRKVDKRAKSCYNSFIEIRLYYYIVIYKERKAG